MAGGLGGQATFELEPDPLLLDELDELDEPEAPEELEPELEPEPEPEPEPFESLELLESLDEPEPEPELPDSGLDVDPDSEAPLELAAVAADDLLRLSVR